MNTSNLPWTPILVYLAAGVPIGIALCCWRTPERRARRRARRRFDTAVEAAAAHLRSCRKPDCDLAAWVRGERSLVTDEA